MPDAVSIFWFRRDLRLEDNAGLYYALKGNNQVLPVFIFDTNILNELNDKGDKRVGFIHRSLHCVQDKLEKEGSSLFVLHGKPVECFKTLADQYTITSVYANHDYEPYALERDRQIADFLKTSGVVFHSYKDEVIFEKNEVVKENLTPYIVYTPYSKKWKNSLTDFYLQPYPVKKYLKNLYKTKPKKIPSLESLGFKRSTLKIPTPLLDESVMRTYDKTRDIPSINSTMRLGVHLRFGTVSIRQLVDDARLLNGTLLNELIWREFFQMILWHFPHTVNKSFKPEYDRIQWRNNGQEFTRWCMGQTGYPIVDAGMRELNETGYMHNRVRMIAASFLVKDLLIDWRWGEAYFAEKLLDYELASNVGNWQWVAGCGTDAAPYFRIFNPQLQTEKFDPQLEYIKKWVPEFDSLNYPAPIVDHNKAKRRCLAAYQIALQK